MINEVNSKTIEQALRESQALLGIIVNSATDGIISIDSEQKIILFNPAAEHLFCRTADEMMGQPLDRLLPARFRAEPSGHLPGFVQAGMGGAKSVSGLRADGAEFPIEAWISQITVETESFFTIILRHLSDRTRAEKTHQEMVAIVDSAEDAIIGKNLDGTIHSWNPGAERLLGYCADEIIGHSVRQLIPEDRISEEMMILEKIKGGERVSSFETIRRRKDGSLVEVSVSVSPIYDQSRTVVGASKIARDITARKRAEEKLATSELRYRRLFEASKDGILILNGATGKIEDVNPFLLEMLGYSHGDFLDQELWKIGAFKEIVFDQIAFQELRSKKYIRYDSRPLVTKSGLLIAVEFVSNAYEVRGQQILQCNIRDITERQQLERVARESEERFRTMADSISQLAWIARADGFIFWYNRRWFEYTGTTPQQMEGRGWQSVHDPTMLPAVMQSWKDAIDIGKAFEMEFPLRGTDGRFRTFLTQVQPLMDSEGGVVQWFGTHTDVDALREAKEILEQKVAERTAELQRAKGRAESADRLKSEFLANMSHELRTPLNGIIGFTEFLVDEKPGPLNPKQREYLIDVHNSAQHLLQLINDVLDLAKVEAGRSELRLEIFSPAKAIREVCAVAEVIARKKRVKLKVTVADGPEAVILDERKFKQICYNLISNAVKFTEAGGHVEIVAERPEAGFFALRITDTGVGIEAEDLPRLFREFEQLDSGISRRFEGTGLGLALTKKLVDAQGGSVSVKSEFGKGSTFSVVLPIGRQKFQE